MLNFSLLSSVIPSSLISSLRSIVSPQTSMGRRDHFLFHVNMTILVLSALMLSPLDWHQFSIVFIVVCVRCQITSRLFPSARDMMSSAKLECNPGCVLLCIVGGRLLPGSTGMVKAHHPVGTLVWF